MSDHRPSRPVLRIRSLGLALCLAAAFPAPVLALSTSIHGKVLEGALVNFDPESGTARVKPCHTCRVLVLEITERTEIEVDGKTGPVTKDTEVGGLVDTMYDPRDNTVLWFRPLTKPKRGPEK